MNARLALVPLIVALTLSPLAAQQPGISCNCQSAGEGLDSTFPFDEMAIWEPNAIYLTIEVPELTLDCPKDATVLINGDKTASKGQSRRFIVRNLEPGKLYEFNIIAETVNRGGVELQQREKVAMVAGESRSIKMKPIKRKIDVEKAAAEEAKKAAKNDSDDEKGSDTTDKVSSRNNSRKISLE